MYVKVEKEEPLYHLKACASKFIVCRLVGDSKLTVDVNHFVFAFLYARIAMLLKFFFTPIQ